MNQDFKDLLRALYDEFGDEGIEFVKNQGASFVRNQMAARTATPESEDGDEDDGTDAATADNEEPIDGANAYDDADAFGVAVKDRMGNLAQVAIRNPADVVPVVADMIRMAGEVRKFEEAQITRRTAIAAQRDVAIASIRARREVLQDYLARSFDERAENFSRLFDVVDTALDTNNMQALAMGLDSVVKLAASSPFKDLRSVEETTTALTDPDHEWDF